MKMFLRALNMLFFIWMMFIFHVKLTDSQVLTLCTNSPTGSQCKLTCKTPDVSQTILFIKLPASGLEGGCASGTCGATAGRTRYTVTHDAALNETYLDISSLVYADDDSQWVCDYGASRSPAVQLTVISLPTTVHFAPDPPTADLSQLLVMEAFCVYPVSSLTPKLVYQDGQTNTILDMTYPVSSTAGTNGCGAHEFTVTGSFQLSPTTLSGKRVQFWIEATVAGQVFGSALTTQFFDFPGSTLTALERETFDTMGDFRSRWKSRWSSLQLYGRSRRSMYPRWFWTIMFISTIIKLQTALVIRSTSECDIQLFTGLYKLLRNSPL